MGYFYLVSTIIIWGTWLFVSRKSSQKLNNPFAENFLITVGALLFNIILFTGFFFSSPVQIHTDFFLPIISGILWSIAGLTAFLSIQRIGLGRAFSIWAPCGMIVSFLWGILYYNEFQNTLHKALLAIILTSFGVFLVIQSRASSQKKKVTLLGAFFAIFSSLIWGGTYLVPVRELGSNYSPFLLNFPLSIGMVVGATIILTFFSGKYTFSISYLKEYFPIVVSGIMWAMGNMFATLAVFHIGMGKAYPLAELCGVLNALICVFVLKEIVNSEKKYLFFLGTFLSFLGAIYLSFLKI